jgi:hypothetical protein
MQHLARTILSTGLCLLAAGRAAAQEAKAVEVRATEVRREGGTVVLPRGDLFRPLIADPKEASFFASLLSESSPSRGSRTGSVGLGGTVGLVRWAGARPGDGIQVGLSGGVLAQFDLSKRSHDLINADYLIGVPLTYRNGPYSARFRFYHQSSHLGDEFVENNEGTRRLNLSFEAFELLVAREFGPVRGYGGGEYRFNRTPRRDLEHWLLHGGLEYRYPRPLVRLGAGGLRPIVAVDAQSFQQSDWHVGWSGRLGVELGPREGGADGAPTVSFLLELYQGPNPYGQFYFEGISSVGFGAHFTY